MNCSLSYHLSLITSVLPDVQTAWKSAQHSPCCRQLKSQLQCWPLEKLSPQRPTQLPEEGTQVFNVTITVLPLLLTSLWHIGAMNALQGLNTCLFSTRSRGSSSSSLGHSKAQQRKQHRHFHLHHQHHPLHRLLCLSGIWAGQQQWVTKVQQQRERVMESERIRAYLLSVSPLLISSQLPLSHLYTGQQDS